ncbi:MAG: MarR family winged helix-turn-helix transcriptional regulator [Janthinobacterium lividum]
MPLAMESSHAQPPDRPPVTAAPRDDGDLDGTFSRRDRPLPDPPLPVHPLPDHPLSDHAGLVAAMADQLVRQQRALHSLRSVFARGESDVERAMHVVLHLLADTGPLRASALAERLGTDPSTTSRQTGELVKRNLLEKLPDPDDRRASLLAVTAAGYDVVAVMRERRHDRLQRAVESFSDEDLTGFTDLLGRFADGLDRVRVDASTLRPAQAVLRQ